MTWSSLNSLSFFNTAAIFGSIRPCNQSVFLKQQIIIFQFSKSTLHVRMVEQIVESLMVAHKDSVQVESPQPKHSPDLVLLVQLPKSSHWVTLELFHPDQLEEVAKLKVSIYNPFLSDFQVLPEANKCPGLAKETISCRSKV